MILREAIACATLLGLILGGLAWANRRELADWCRGFIADVRTQ